MSKEIIMAQEVAETPVQAPDKDAIDTVKGVEKFLAEARNQAVGRLPGPEDLERLGITGAPRPDRSDAGGAAAGGGGDNGGEGPGGPEAFQPPEGFRSPEGRTSPEYGRWLADQLEVMRTAMLYEQRYDEENGPRLKWLYDLSQEYVDEICEIRNDPDPFDLHKAFPKPIRRRIQVDVDGITVTREVVEQPDFAPLPQARREMKEAVREFLSQYQLEGTEETGEPEAFVVEPLPDPDDVSRSINTRRVQYHNRGEEFEAAQADLQNYFKHAKNLGLLEEVDAVLNSIHQEIVVASGRGIPPTEIQDALDRRIDRVRQIARVEFQEKRLANPAIPQVLSAVGDAYIDWAERRLQLRLYGQPELGHREGEWSVPTPDQASRSQKTTFWEVGSYPKYYHITARTPEQFLTAKDSFLQMIRAGSVGKSPTAIFEHVKNFIEVFGSEGGKQVREGHVGADFMERNRLELEALLYVFVGNYANEVYNPKQRKEAMMAMSLDEGPARWVALYGAGKGGIAAFSHIFDEEALMDIFMNPVGERGELDIIAGHFLQDEIQKKVIERGMGIVLKDYDPRDEYFSSPDDLGAKIAAAVDLKRINEAFDQNKQDVRYYIGILKRGRRAERQLSERDREGIDVFKKHLKQLGLTEGQFKDLEESQVEQIAETMLSERDRDRKNAFETNLKRLGLTKSPEEFKALFEGFDKGDYHIKNYDHYREDQKQPENQRQYPAWKDLPESIRKSIDLGRIQFQLRKLRQEIRDGRIKLERGERAIDRLNLNPRDKKIYEEAYEEASANFDVAFQMQGVLGEKARRGRGFLYAERNPHMQYYFSIGDQLRLQWVDEKRTEVINIDTLKVQEIEKIRDTLPQDKRRSFEIGWMLYKMRDGKKLDTFPQYWQDLYNHPRMNPEDKNVFVDNIPTYQAENFVNWAVFWTKMKYADAPAKVRRQKVRETRERHIKELQTKGYAAQLWDDFTLLRGGKPIASENIGYDRNSNPVSLSFNTEGVPVGIEFDNDGAVIFDSVDQRNRRRIQFDNLDRNTRFPPKLMTFKRPKGEINRATGMWKASRDALGNVIVENAVATFQIAAQSHDFRNRYTDHTYWYYQGNTKDSILARRIREAAERIQKGESRPEDEDPLATQLLIVDPTLRRVKKFDGVDQAIEVALIAAAVLESFQDKQWTKHALHRAFLPKDGYFRRMRAGYRNEDWAGMDRFTMGFEEFAGQQSLRFARRGAAWIANVPFEHDAAGSRWGVHGVSGAVKVMADEIKKYSHQGIVSQFGLTKIFEVFDKAVEMFNHIAGYVDPQTGEWKFGLAEKPTDNNETMHAFTAKALSGILLDSATETIPFLYEYKKCFERLINVTHDMRVMYSAIDNSAGAINLEEVDVFDLEDGSLNTAAIIDRKVYLNNGTARNRQNAFLYGEEDWEGFYKWLQDGSPGGGADVYRRERYWNSYLGKTFKVYEGGKTSVGAERVDVWLTDKII